MHCTHITRVSVNMWCAMGLLQEASGAHKGFCFVEYATVEAAELCRSTMNGFTLGGRQLKIGSAGGRPPQPQPQAQGQAQGATALNPSHSQSISPLLLQAPSVASVPVPVSGSASVSAVSTVGARIVALRNFVDSTDLDPQLEADVREEAEKFGVVQQVTVTFTCTVPRFQFLP